LLSQPIPVPADPSFERLRDWIGQRAVGLAVALVLEAGLLLLLLSLSQVDVRGKERETLVEFKAIDTAEPEIVPPEFAARRPKAAEFAPVDAPQSTDVAAPQPEEAPVATLPPVPSPREPDPRYGVGPRPIVGAPAGPAFGPANTRRSDDSVSIGTAPNGETLYQARWYREPYDDELRGYLSTATGPGWGLIACRTVADFRVEDCVGLDEYPRGSMIMRSALAAAWQFKVRPPRLGGRSLVGAWVRIRIDYQITPARDGRSRGDGQ